jgi:hypothetical protein
MAKRLSLDELMLKPMPNKKQKTGVEIILEKSTEVVVNEHADEETLEINESETVTKHEVKIVEKLDKNFDRVSIFKRLQSKNVFSVKKPIPVSQVAEELVETALEPVKEQSEKEEEEKDEVDENEEKEEELKGEKEPTLPKGEVKKPRGKKEKEGESSETKEKKPRGKKVEETVTGDVDVSSIAARLPVASLPKGPVTMIKASPYYMNNRKLFIEKLGPLFQEYKRELTTEEKVSSCSHQKTSSEVKLLVHQKVVRDYLNLYSPYRGLLLYHGLGTGKTISSIAIAEGLKSEKHIFVMTLASLKMNFFTQMKEAGDPLYKKNQFWEFVSVEGEPDKIPILAKALSIGADHIKRLGGAWLTDVTKEPNFNDLSESDQKALDTQIDMMIRSKYTDINYNGLNRAKLDELTGSGKKNPFNHSVVIIDEAHNFVSRIVNKIKDKKSISYRLYEYLMEAEDCRIVFLSGTPIINYPNEIGILFNMLRGYIKTWTFPVRLREGNKERPSRDNIMTWFKRDGLKTYDYVEFSGDHLIITRNPFGFINADSKDKTEGKKGGSEQALVSKKKDTKKKAIKMKDSSKKHRTTRKATGLVELEHLEIEDLPEDSEESELNREHIGPNGPFALRTGGGVFEDYKGVKLDDTGNMTDSDFVKTVKRIMEKNGLDVIDSGIELTNNKALPDDAKSFLELFVELDSKDMKNKKVFQRRILGLTSYFNSVSPGLLPDFVPSEDDPVYHIVRSEMSAYQFGLYEKIRAEESKRERTNKLKKAKLEKQGANEDLFKIATTYRIGSRTCCNFAFPDPPGRPTKGAGDYGGEEDVVDLEEVGEEPDQKKKRLKKGGAGSDDEKEKKPVKIVAIRKTKKKEPTSEATVSEALKPNSESKPIIKIRKTKKNQPPVEKEPEQKEEDKEPEEKEKESEQEEKEEDKEPEKEEHKEPEQEDKEDSDSEQESDSETESVDEGTFATRIRNALIELKKRQSEVLSPTGLQIYSPKFLRILENLQSPEHKGLHLIYSQFRTLEGIGILKLVLEANGFAEFKLEKNGSTGQWKMVDLDEENRRKPRFVLYTGTETPEEKEVIRNVYNSSWKNVPESLLNQIREYGGTENNFMGEVIKIFMITASGAEGINLKNTRYVHIVEPYWHMVRIEQVIGRARRICSHQDLPEELRTIEVFLYMSVLSEEQITGEKTGAAIKADMSKLVPNKGPVSEDRTVYDRYTRTLLKAGAIITTDQMLFENALRKDRVSHQILTAVKETAMDCDLYSEGHKEENFKCFSDFGKVSTNAFGSYPDLSKDVAEKDVKEVAQKVVKMGTVTFEGTKYAINKDTKELYDLAEFKKAKGIEGIKRLGTLVKEGKKYVLNK